MKCDARWTISTIQGSPNEEAIEGSVPVVLRASAIGRGDLHIRERGGGIKEVSGKHRLQRESSELAQLCANHLWRGPWVLPVELSMPVG